MPNSSFPFAVRMLGFSAEEADLIETAFVAAQGKGYGYFRLADDNLQDPDLYLVNAGELKALAMLSDLRPSTVRPALLVGVPGITLPYAHVERPLQWNDLFGALGALVEQRADALSRLNASELVLVPERRRRERVDLDLTDPSEYLRMRAKVPADSGILVVDKNPAFRDYLAELLMRYSLPIAWAGDEAQAADLCSRESMALVLINTTTAGVDPYRLSQAIKRESRVEKSTVVLLVSAPFVYDSAQARAAGVDGFLNKPVAGHHLLAVLKKFLPALSR